MSDEIEKMTSGGYLLAWLDHAPTEEIEEMYRRSPDGDYRDAIAIELQRRKDSARVQASWLEKQANKPT